jgi:signal transduction histidine kinase
MLRALLQRAGRSVVAHPLRTDTVLAVALTGVAVVQVTDGVVGPWETPDGAAVALTVFATLPTAFRRRAPITVMLVCTAAWGLYAACGYFLGANTYGMLLGLYTVATVHPWRRTLACAALGGGIWIVSGVAIGAYSVAAVIGQGVVIPAVVWKMGDGAKRLAASNGRLAAAGQALARQAVVDERLRIARELHDVVAHHMSVIAVQTGLARYVLRSDPDTANTALGTVLDTGAEALDELRRLLELLRLGSPDTSEAASGGADPDGYEPAPGLAFLPELFNRIRAAGVPVEVEVTGTPHPLPSGVELCAYRIIQESLTNVLKHATPATARVHLQYGAGEFAVTVTDDGIGTTAGTGNGLIGMRERAMLYGGTLRAGPRPDGGFEVRLVVPVAGPRA